MHLVKKWIRSWLRSRGQEVVYRPQALIGNPRAVLEPTLEMVLAARHLYGGGLTVVQVGAFDGQAGDPVYPFLTRTDTRGVVVEPQARFYQALVRAYAGHPNVTPVRAAVAEADGERVLYTVRDVADPPEWLHQIASFRKEVVLKHAPEYPGLEALVTPVPVRCVTPRTLLAETGIDAVGALVIDTEGYDYEVIKLFRAAGVRPAVVFYEHKHLVPPDHEACLAELVADGYQVAVSRTDVLACRPPGGP